MKPSDDKYRLPSIRRFWSVGGVSVVAALAATWYGIGVRPAVAEIDRLRQEADEARQFLLTEVQLTRQLKRIEAQHEVLATQHAAARLRAEAAGDEVGFLRWLSACAAKHTLRIADYRPLGYAEYGDYRGRVLQLSTEGSYAAVCNVLNDLRQSPQLNRVTSVSLAPAGASEGGLRAVIKIELLAPRVDTKTSAGDLQRPTRGA